MSDTRIMPKARPRSTGIERTNTQVVRPQSDGASSHVSASAGSGKGAQEQVRRARHQGPPPGGRGDARVQLVDRASAAGAGGGPNGPKVQLLDRVGPGQRPAAGEAAVPRGLTLDHAMLIGHLLDRYEEGARAIQDAANADLARGALEVVGAYVKSLGSAAPGPVAGGPAPSTPGAPTVEILSRGAAAPPTTTAAPAAPADPTPEPPRAA